MQVMENQRVVYYTKCSKPTFPKTSQAIEVTAHNAIYVTVMLSTVISI